MREYGISAVSASAFMRVTNRGAVCKIGQVTACKCVRLGAQCAVYGELFCTELGNLRPVPRTIGSSLMHVTRSTQLRRAVAQRETRVETTPTEDMVVSFCYDILVVFNKLSVIIKIWFSLADSVQLRLFGSLWGHTVCAALGIWRDRIVGGDGVMDTATLHVS